MYNKRNSTEIQAGPTNSVTGQTLPYQDPYTNVCTMNTEADLQDAVSCVTGDMGLMGLEDGGYNHRDGDYV